MSGYLEESIAIEGDVLRRDGGRYILGRGRDEVDSILGGDVLQDNAQVRQLLSQRLQLLLYKDSFSVKHVHMAVSHLPMHQQKQAFLLPVSHVGFRGKHESPFPCLLKSKI